MDVAKFFNRWFYVAVILVLIGLTVSRMEVQNPYLSYGIRLSENLFQTTGIAILVANIFTFTIGTSQFMNYIRQRLIDIVVSKDFIERLSQEEQRDLLKMTLKPPRSISEIYSGIDDYFQNYINESMQLFDTCYRGHYVVNAEAYVDDESGKLKIVVDLDYIVYRIAEKFDPLVLSFEDEEAKHITTTIKSPAGHKEVLTQQTLTEIGEIPDPCMKKAYEMEVPEKFNEYRHINISRRVEEFGQDHWQVFSYKTIKACDQMLLNLRCADDIVVRRCDTYGAQEDFDIQTSDDQKRIRVAYNDWLKPGFGVNILVAREGWH